MPAEIQMICPSPINGIVLQIKTKSEVSLLSHLGCLIKNRKEKPKRGFALISLLFFYIYIRDTVFREFFGKAQFVENIRK